MPSANGSSLQIGMAVLHARLTRLRKGSRLTENTHSGTASTNYDAVVPDNSWSGSIPWDEANIPDTDFGLTPGTKVDLIFNVGDTGLTEELEDTTVEYVEDIFDNAGDIIRTEVSGKGGVLTPAIGA
jgi:molybdopterin biosynthesis enzyme MoaB